MENSGNFFSYFVATLSDVIYHVRALFQPLQSVLLFKAIRPKVIALSGVRTVDGAHCHNSICITFCHLCTLYCVSFVYSHCNCMFIMLFFTVWNIHPLVGVHRPGVYSKYWDVLVLLITPCSPNALLTTHFRLLGW